MSVKDPVLEALGHSFGRDYADREGPKQTLVSLLSDEGFKKSLKDGLNSTVVIESEQIRVETPFGVLSLDFAPVIEGPQCGWVVVFGDSDEFGQRRDLYAVRLSSNKRWVDGSGTELTHSEDWTEPSIVTAIQMVQRALAAKLRQSEARVAKLFA